MRKLTLIVLVALLALSACTSTAVPSSTPVPTLGETRDVTGGGFSFQIPPDYSASVDGGRVDLSDKQGSLLLHLYGEPADVGETSLEKIVDSIVSEAMLRGNGVYEKSAVYTVTVAGVKGNGYDLSGTYFGAPFEGQAVIVPRKSGGFFFGMGLALGQGEEGRWQKEGKAVFQAMLQTVQFTDKP